MRGWIVVQCDPSECGADSVMRCFGVFDSEDVAAKMLADIRDDDPDFGDGWTCVEVHDAG
jgi:hypothetical protein